MNSHSQNGHILSLLQAGQSLTPLEALERFGTARLAARIHDLAQGVYDGKNYDIETVIMHREGKRFASYRLRNPLIILPPAFPVPKLPKGRTPRHTFSMTPIKRCPACMEELKTTADGREMSHARECRMICRALIHVGFEGSTICANSKPCPLHNGDGTWKRSEGLRNSAVCQNDDCDGDLQKVPGGHVHSATPES